MDEILYLSGLAHNLPCKLEGCWCNKVDTESKDYCPMSLWKKVEKPWGCYYDIYRSKTTVMKKIVVNPGCRISYQIHTGRSEFWSIECGKAQVTINDYVQQVEAGAHFYIRKLDKHRIANIGTDPLVIFEIQNGDCSEDDITRFSDDYSRQN